MKRRQRKHVPGKVAALITGHKSPRKNLKKHHEQEGGGSKRLQLMPYPGSRGREKFDDGEKEIWVFFFLSCL